MVRDPGFVDNDASVLPATEQTEQLEGKSGGGETRREVIAIPRRGAEERGDIQRPSREGQTQQMLRTEAHQLRCRG